MTRIISGRARGRRLSTLPGDNTRPTSDRVREALFSAISSWLGTTGDAALADIAFADLYAGSGAIGLEAASRGAQPVLLVEAHRPAVMIINKNLESCGLSAKVVGGTAQSVTGRPTDAPFDVVFLDPPYLIANSEVELVLGQLVANGWLRPDALVVVERSARTEPFTWPDALENCWKKSYGETVLYFAQS